jgi:ankyrin repeat protein
MLDTGANANDIEAISGWSPLLRAACVNAPVELAQLLIRHGADVNWCDREKKSPLIMAAVNGHLPLVEILVKSGANVHVTTEAGKSIYELARSMGRREVLSFLDTFAQDNGIKIF